MDRWSGKVAIVTGASSGIGAAIAEQLVQEGLQVAGFARRPENVVELSKKLKDKKGKLHAVEADLTSEESILNGFKWVTDNLGPVSILINNAGMTSSTSLVDGSTKVWRQTLDTNVLGLCIATREAVKIMRENHIDGHIVHIGSILGHTVLDVPDMNVYPATKFAVRALTESLRQELMRIGSKIKISCVSPGLVATELLIRGQYKVDPKVLEAAPALSSRDVAGSILYVLSTPPHVQVHDLIIQPVGQLCKL